jgi:hypothetical protein
MESKDIFKYALIAGAAYLVYQYVIAPFRVERGLGTPSDPSLPTTAAPTGSTTTATTPVNTNVVAAPLPPNATIASSDFATPGWLARTGSVMGSAAGTANAGFDAWSYYYQHNGGSAITPDLMDRIIAAGGGDRTKQITATDFLQYLVTAVSATTATGGGGATGLAGFVGLGDFWRV